MVHRGVCDLDHECKNLRPFLDKDEPRPTQKSSAKINISLISILKKKVTKNQMLNPLRELWNIEIYTKIIIKLVSTLPNLRSWFAVEINVSFDDFRCRAFFTHYVLFRGQGSVVRVGPATEMSGRWKTTQKWWFNIVMCSRIDRNAVMVER